MPEVLQRIGGPYSVSWFAFWVTLAANTLHHIGGSPDLPGYWGPRIVAVLVSQAAMFGVLLIAKATLLRNTAVRPRPWATLACFAVAGAVRSVALMAVWSPLVDLQAAQVAQRLISGGVSFAAYLAVCAYLVDLFQENKRTIERSEQTEAALAAARLQAEAIVESQGREGWEEARAEIAAQLDIQYTSALSPEQLDAFLDDALRPMIRQRLAGIRPWVAPTQSAVDPRLSRRRILDSVGLNRPFSPGVQAILSVVAILGIVTYLPFWHSLAALASAFFGPWVMLTVGNRVLRGLTPRMSALVRLAAVSAWILVSAIVVGAVWALAMLGTAYVRPGMSSGVLLTILLGFATVVANAILTAQRTSESELSASSARLRWEVARLHQVQWRQQQQLARALHGPVQTAVIQTAMKPDGADVVVVRERLTEALQEALQDRTTSASVPAVLAEVSRSWSSICEVTGEVDPAARAADGDGLAVACLSEFLQEGVANAVRHGGARNVTITIGTEDECLQVTVDDDGGASSASGGTGLGSRMMDDCCLAWKRERTADGTRLWFLLPAHLSAL